MEPGKLVYSAAFSSDGALIGSGLWDHDYHHGVSVRTIEGELIKELKGLDDRVNSLAFSPHGDLILVGLDNGTACVYEVSTGHKRRELKGHTDSICSVVFSSDGTTMLTGSTDCTTRLWNTATGRLLKILEGHWGQVNSVAYSPHSKTLLTGSSDKTVRVWSSKISSSLKGYSLKELKGHTAAISSVTLSSDGMRILSGSSDGTARLWDAETGEPLVTFTCHTGPVMDVLFGYDDTIITGSSDQTLCLWGGMSDGGVKEYRPVETSREKENGSSSVQERASRHSWIIEAFRHNELSSENDAVASDDTQENSTPVEDEPKSSVESVKDRSSTDSTDKKPLVLGFTDGVDLEDDSQKECCIQ